VKDSRANRTIENKLMDFAKNFSSSVWKLKNAQEEIVFLIGILSQSFSLFMNQYWMQMDKSYVCVTRIKPYALMINSVSNTKFNIFWVNVKPDRNTNLSLTYTVSIGLVFNPCGKRRYRYCITRAWYCFIKKQSQIIHIIFCNADVNSWMKWTIQKEIGPLKWNDENDKMPIIGKRKWQTGK